MLSHVSKKNNAQAASGGPASPRGGPASLHPAQARGAGATLSITALERLAPHGYLKAGYPHVWERIWLFCGDPAHLEKYLASLSIQDRNGKRDGLRPQAMVEITDIQAANQRLLGPSAAIAAGWDDDTGRR
ncbi:MAG: hypothetical protein ABWY27_16180 [Telluria sp.]